MKTRFLVICSSLLLLVPGYSSPVQSANAGAQQEQKLDDGQIINIMMSVDKVEIAASKEAEKKKASPTVDNYAKYLIQQHQSDLDELTQLSKELRIDSRESTISRSLATSGKQTLENLSKLQGQEFERAYIDAMVKDHQGGLD